MFRSAENAQIAWGPLLFLALLLALAIGCTDDESDTPYRIGAMDALTGVGESYGNPLLQAKLLAVEEINAAGGINGRDLELIVEDSKCAAQDAIAAYNKLTDVDGVKIILGTTCSGAMLGAAPLAEEEGVILLSPSATSPDIANAGDYIFRTAINDLQLGVDIGNLLWVDGARKLSQSLNPPTTQRAPAAPLSHSSRGWAAPLWRRNTTPLR